MNDAALAHSLTPTPLFGVTDEQLTAEMKKCSGKPSEQQPAGELLGRHWEAAFSYASVCTTGSHPAGILTSAAFTRLFAEALRRNTPAIAWRPRVLATVRGIAEEWNAGPRAALLHPGLRAVPRERGRADGRFRPPENRRLVFRAFQKLPEAARCLLWHTEVEAERLAVPAGLLGLSDDAPAELERARLRWRQACLEAHRDTAPEEECRQYSRLLDVSLRRGDTRLDPDLRQHLVRCEHCRHAADQLDHSTGRVALLLAEAVLGWGARDYLDSRPGRRIPEPGPVAAPPPMPSVPPRGAGPRHSAGKNPWWKARPAARRRRPGLTRGRLLVMTAATVSGCVLVSVAVASVLPSGAGENAAYDRDTPSSQPAAGAGDTTAPGSDPSWIGADGRPDDTLRGRLRNAANGLCLDIVGGKPEAGAETEATPCTSAATQQWSYEADGLLRSRADPDLCLNSRLSFAVQLGSCATTSQRAAANVRYDFTLQGTLVPRWNQELALTPDSTEKGAGMVLKTRDDSARSQRWLAGGAANDNRYRTETGRPDREAAPRQVSAVRPKPARTAPPARAPEPSAPPKSAPSSRPSSPAPHRSKPPAADPPPPRQAGSWYGRQGPYGEYGQSGWQGQYGYGGYGQYGQAPWASGWAGHDGGRGGAGYRGYR
ncbi:RICIN domain-containing protein [Streptomyces sp. NBRC 110028]|uniref:RICIN domain-containing protein n=1 Tax=Streptomyces sp. NBRC 110028 TaxID=1621260 RepID=UPI0006E25038|nr:RICIN domain-containing protein [Streptomyces sp. NBRC 110028]